MNQAADRHALLALLEPATAQRVAASTTAPAAWLQAVANAVQRASPPALAAAGLLPGEGSTTGERRVLAAAGSGAPDGLWLLQLSPARAHRVLAWLPDSAGPWCTQLWFDARPQSWPAGVAPGVLLPGHWADEHHWAAAFAPLQHPLQDWGRNAGLGVQRGLWVLGAEARVLLPPADQHWPDPQLFVSAAGAPWRLQPAPGAALMNLP